MADIHNANVPFKFTFAIDKAEERDGAKYVYGVATGLGIDDDGHEMDPSAIEDIAQQFNDRAAAGDPIPYKDWHQKNSIMSDMGYVTKAEVDEAFRIGVEVRLDEDSPTAEYHYKKLRKGKQFGMSIGGTVEEFTKSFSGSREVLRFLKVVIDELSSTTKPRWTPSFGTVLAKAVMDKEGDQPVPNEANPTAPAPIETPTPESVETPPVPASDEKPAEAVTEDNGERPLTRTELVAALTELGLVKPAETKPDTSDSTSSADDAAPSAPAEAAQPDPKVEALEKTVAELTAAFEALRNSPAPTPPALAEPEPAKDPTADLLKAMEGKTPFERMSLGLQLAAEAKRK